MKGRLVLAVAAVGSLAVAGCSSSSSSTAASGGTSGTSSASAATKSCVASVGFEGPITGPVAPLGTEQLHFAQLARVTDNLTNKTEPIPARWTGPGWASSPGRRPRWR